ncbi:MAG: hypothetical protein ACRDRJ_47505 [Streptosporangiaceae bacterium]
MNDWAGRGWAQRWLDGRQTWAVPGPRFRPARYDVAHVGDQAARAFVTRHHYLKSWVASTRRTYGMFDTAAVPSRLVGVAVMAIPPNKLVLTNHFPTLEPYDQSLVLARLVLLDQIPHSAESWFMTRVCRLAAEDGLRGVVMDSDPVPRYRPDGRGGWEQWMPGHCGTVYQACNFRYLGQTGPQSQWALPGGLVISRRSLQKVRARETGHRYVEAALIELGAEPMRPGEDPRAWLRHAKLATGARSAQHPGYHRYAVALGGRRRGRPEPVPIPGRVLRYPKKDRDRQLDLFGETA